MLDDETFLKTIPKFLRRPPESACAQPAFTAVAPPAPLRALPLRVIHGGTPPARPPFAPVPDIEAHGPAVVDLSARRTGAASQTPPAHAMQARIESTFGAEHVPDQDGDAAFQVTLPRSVIRQIRVIAAEEGTTHRAIVLRALRAAGLSVPEGADVDRRVTAARRRQQA